MNKMAGEIPKHIHVLDTRFAHQHWVCEIVVPHEFKRNSYKDNIVKAEVADNLPVSFPSAERHQNFWDPHTDTYYKCSNEPSKFFQHKEGLVFTSTSSHDAAQRSEAARARQGTLANRKVVEDCVSLIQDLPKDIDVPPWPETVVPENGRPGKPLFYVTANRTDGYGDVINNDEKKCTPLRMIRDTRVYKYDSTRGVQPPSKVEYRRTRTITVDGTEYRNCFDPIVGYTQAYDNVIDAKDTHLEVLDTATNETILFTITSAKVGKALVLKFHILSALQFTFTIREKSNKQVLENSGASLISMELADLMRQYFRLYDGDTRMSIDYENMSPRPQRHTWISWHRASEQRLQTAVQVQSKIQQQAARKRRRSLSESSSESDESDYVSVGDVLDPEAINQSPSERALIKRRIATIERLREDLLEILSRVIESKAHGHVDQHEVDLLQERITDFDDVLRRLDKEARSYVGYPYVSPKRRRRTTTRIPQQTVEEQRAVHRAMEAEKNAAAANEAIERAKRYKHRSEVAAEYEGASNSEDEEPRRKTVPKLVPWKDKYAPRVRVRDETTRERKVRELQELGHRKRRCNCDGCPAPGSTCWCCNVKH